MQLTTLIACMVAGAAAAPAAPAPQVSSSSASSSFVAPKPKIFTDPLRTTTLQSTRLVTATVSMWSNSTQTQKPTSAALSERQLGGNAVPAIPSLPGLPVRRSVAAPAPSANPDADAFALDSGLPASMSLPQASQSLPANHAGHGLLPAIPKIPLRRAAETASAEATSSSAGGLLGGIPGLGNLPVRREATRTITGHSPETSAAGLIPGLDDLPIRRDAQGDLGLGAIDSLPINNLAGKADSASSVSLGGSMQGVSISTVPALPLRREASATASSKAATSSAAGALGGLPGMGSLPGLDSLNKLDNLRREPSPASSSAASTTSAAGMLGGLGLNKILGGAGGLKRDVVPTMTFPVHTIDAAVMQSLQNSNRVAPTGAPAHGQHNAHGQHLPRAAATSSSAATTSSAAAGMLGGLGLDKILGGVKRDDESGMEAAVMQSIWDRQSKMEHKTATGTASATASGAAGFGALTEGLQNGAGQIQHNLPVRRDAEEKPSPAKKAEASTSSAPTASASADKKEGLDGILGMLGMGGDKKGDESAASTSSMSGSTTASAPATSSSASKAAGLGGVLGGIRRDAPITQKPEGSATASAKVSMVTQTDNPSGFFGQGLTGVTSGNLMDSLSPDSLPNVDSVGAGAAPLPIRARDEGEKKHGEEATASKTVSAVPSATSAAGGLGSLNDILGGLRKRQGYGLDKLDKVEDLTSGSTASGLPLKRQIQFHPEKLSEYLPLPSLPSLVKRTASSTISSAPAATSSKAYRAPLIPSIGGVTPSLGGDLIPNADDFQKLGNSLMPSASSASSSTAGAGLMGALPTGL